ncbi:DUF3466 family protein [Vibrio sp. 404]|uniref:DUF3466 family protein n=1 Tax=Vibrio marinisediminis TaxID=2758441 RepID=A0A7W2FRN5_9VIBR|nr:DUF3466 family protein [Vibrio marinisediminis]MBA5762904.1 DUF3466 family protein [Vibrio marinisediminis]
MRCNLFKLSAVTATILASFGANAALYNVYHYAPEGTDIHTYGVAVKPDASDCWSATNCNDSDATVNSFVITMETKKNEEGFSYRDESPFLLNKGYYYLDFDDSPTEDKIIDGFTSYCNDYLRYDADYCKDNWAKEQSAGYTLEILDKDYTNLNSSLSTGSFSISGDNLVVNYIDPTTGKVTGNHRDGDAYRNVAFSDSALLSKPSDMSDFRASHAWKRLGNYTVGSISRENARDPNDSSSKAAVWIGDGNSATVSEIKWSDGASSSHSNRVVPQGGARDIIHSGDYFAVGYNSTDKELSVAAVFELGDMSDIANANTKYVTPYTDDEKYAHSILTSVNDNKVAIGSVKYRVNNNGSYSNSLFYVPDITAGTLSSTPFSGSIFFQSANGKAGAINNLNEVVGEIDYQQHKEVGSSSPRAKRAFVTVISDKTISKAPFKNSAYYLDDLTSGSDALTDNNQYRIINATDINDASVISGTALFCAGGYDTQAINSTCNGGATGSEKLVAVKLIPIQGGTIQPRPVDQVKVERQGGSLGWLALGLLALLGFRRKQ